MDIKFDTLKYLVNNDLSIADTKTEVKSNLNKGDKKFYKKRLLAVTKSLFKEESFNDSPKSIQSVFENYVSEMIEIFKDIDLNEERKKEYENMIEKTNNLDSNDDTLNLLEYDIENIKLEPKQIKIEDCMDIKNLKEVKPPFFPKEKKYNLKTKINKKKRII
tara:strand:- start:912 stop:1397 length:486 start_codon:yes stop_codon:yes gene_type:complete